MKRNSVWIRAGALAAALSVVMVHAVEAGSHPHDRNGFMLGFGLGGGSLGLDDSDEREGSGVGNFRIGYAVRPDLVLHFEGSAWTKTFDDTLGDVTWTFSTGTAALTWFPNAGGAFLRGGIGGGGANVEVEVNGVTLSAEETGFGLLLASGYQWRLTPKFALGPHAEFTWVGLDELGSANRFGAALDFDWFW